MQNNILLFSIDIKGSDEFCYFWFVLTIFEIPKRKADVERGAPEQEIAKHGWENNANDNSYWQQGHITDKFRWMVKPDEENRTGVDGD
jgi:hypothetical protein